MFELRGERVRVPSKCKRMRTEGGSGRGGPVNVSI